MIHLPNLYKIKPTQEEPEEPDEPSEEFQTYAYICPRCGEKVLAWSDKECPKCGYYFGI